MIKSPSSIDGADSQTVLNTLIVDYLREQKRKRRFYAVQSNDASLRETIQSDHAANDYQAVV